ncbi:phosphoadenosine phosphosulfate reductase domain-containing protein [Rhizosphaericola mali]|uniref:Phosphoadenosine phosphosulfate reductase family protein n=1 Tax=Rhizosphaericola mali TaxID=2545455 RepID=A0A5P2GBA7_9BACT|nr:phosphoadenosine phosphosulfate reductase family protein [Rhizosphaericola mali]QES88841.1 phosphoadenosine phosphosulfate reductase family protein [Rhizosphaericola mali]
MIDLLSYDKIVINSSGGKDSVSAIYSTVQMAISQNYNIDNIIISHQDLKICEWPGTLDLVKKQATFFGIRNVVINSRDESILDYALRRGKWPSSKQRWCTSDFKRAVGDKVITALTRELEGNLKILHVFGFRADESSARSKKQVFVRNERLSTRKRIVDDYLPIHGWSVFNVWECIHGNNIPYHYAYDLGMPRLSCAYCILAPFDALVLSGIHNKELLIKYVEVERIIDHKFRMDFSLEDVLNAVNNGYVPKKINNWKM